MQQLRLDQAYEAILDAAVNRLKEATATGELLSMINSKDIVRGDRAKPSPNTPSIWVYAEAATPDHPPTTLQEKWELPLVLISVVKALEPEDGYRKATEYAAKARSVVIKNRDLGIREIVQGVRSGRFEASYASEQKLNLYSAVAIVNVTFRVREFI